MRLVSLTLLCITLGPFSASQTDWPMYGHDPGGVGFSPLKQIDTKNVGKLQIAWTYDTRPEAVPASEGVAAKPVPRNRASQATPLVVGGMLYLSSPYGRIVALEPETGGFWRLTTSKGAVIQAKAVIVAAGVGARAGPGQAKQWRRLGGKAVARWSAEALLAAGAEELVVVVGEAQEDQAREALAGLGGYRLVLGGAARSDSVKSGLAALTVAGEDIVLVHDAARPLLTVEHVRRLLTALETTPAAILALPLADTLKRDDGTGRIVGTPPRVGLWRAQTPQGFRLGQLRAAYAAWPAGEEPTDEAMVFERAGGEVALVPGDPALAKLTFPEDFAMAERIAGAARTLRIGQGIDAHRFGPGDSVWLCGVQIAHSHALIGHSDADAGLHAITDAVLGAIGEGDIGDHFPPTDPKWRGASSDQFLLHAAGLVAARGGRIVNVDVTLVCERPKIKPHRQAMRQRLAELLGLDMAAVSVKATTMEGMGFTGREEGLLAQAVAMVELPA